MEIELYGEKYYIIINKIININIYEKENIYCEEKYTILDINMIENNTITIEEDNIFYNKEDIYKIYENIKKHIKNIYFDYE